MVWKSLAKVHFVLLLAQIGQFIRNRYSLAHSFGSWQIHDQGVASRKVFWWHQPMAEGRKARKCKTEQNLFQ
jgi:hypothetical protein